jgi:hypothetical protein
MSGDRPVEGERMSCDVEGSKKEEETNNVRAQDKVWSCPLTESIILPTRQLSRAVCSIGGELPVEFAYSDER